MHIFIAIYSISSLQNLLFIFFPFPIASRHFSSSSFALLWPKRPKVLVFALHLAVGTFLQVCFSLILEKALFLCPWTDSVVFAGFVPFFQLELFWPKPLLGIFTNFHTNCFFFFLGGVCVISRLEAWEAHKRFSAQQALKESLPHLHKLHSSTCTGTCIEKIIKLKHFAHLGNRR